MKLSKFLPLLFGCHQKPERSFFFKGKQFPICARCTGILIGWFLTIPLLIFFDIVYWWVLILLLLPGILDGFIQLKTSYRSNNIKRCITGIAMGIAIIYNFAYIHLGTVKLAIIVLESFK